MPENEVVFTANHDKMLRETRDAVIEIKTVLLGTYASKGLCTQVNELEKSLYNIKRNMFIICGLLVGSGIVSGSVYGLLSL